MSTSLTEPRPELDVAVVGAHELPGSEEELAEVLSEVALVLSVGNVDLARIAAAMPPECHCLYVLGSGDDPAAPAPPRCHLLDERGARVFSWGFVGVSGGSEYDEGDTILSEERAAQAVETIEALPDFDVLLTFAPPATAEADTGDFSPIAAFEELYALAPPLFHFYAHSREGGDASEVAGVVLYGINGLTLLRLRRRFEA